VLALNLHSVTATNGSFGNEDSDKSMLSAVSKTLTPVFAPMGIHEDNWPAVVGVVSGVLAKEVVVGTLDTLYTRLAQESAGAVTQDVPFSIWSSLQDAFSTIPENLSALGGMWGDPLGMDVGDVNDTQLAAQEQEVGEGIFGAMVARFDGQAGAFAYLLFVLLYFPCVATIGVIRREAGSAWAAFVAFWTTSVAYVTASVYYQAATYSAHPGSSLGWIAGLSLAMLLVIFFLGRWAGKGEGETQPAVEAST